MRKIGTVMMALGLVALLGTDAAAQRRGLVDVTPDHVRRGFWLDAGIGWGWEAWRFDGESWVEPLGKPTFSFAAGGTPSGQLRIGGEATVWVNRYQDEGDNVTETLGSVMAVARFFPARNLGLYLKGGAGLGVSAVDLEFGSGTSETGFAYVVGAGWEIPLSDRIFLAPAIDWYRHSFEQRGEPTLHERLVNLNLRITAQLGR